MANTMEQALLLPRYGYALKLKKHEMFLSLKRDLALVYSYPFFLSHIYIHSYLILAYKLD